MLRTRTFYDGYMCKEWPPSLSPRLSVYDRPGKARTSRVRVSRMTLNSTHARPAKERFRANQLNPGDFGLKGRFCVFKIRSFFQFFLPLPPHVRKRRSVNTVGVNPSEFALSFHRARAFRALQETSLSDYGHRPCLSSDMGNPSSHINILFADVSRNFRLSIRPLLGTRFLYAGERKFLHRRGGGRFFWTGENCEVFNVFSSLFNC